MVPVVHVLYTFIESFHHRHATAVSASATLFASLLFLAIFTSLCETLYAHLIPIPPEPQAVLRRAS